jgi:hypothetical protein
MHPYRPTVQKFSINLLLYNITLLCIYILYNYAIQNYKLYNTLKQMDSEGVQNSKSMMIIGQQRKTSMKLVIKIKTTRMQSNFAPIDGWKLSEIVKVDTADASDSGPLYGYHSLRSCYFWNEVRAPCMDLPKRLICHHDGWVLCFQQFLVATFRRKERGSLVSCKVR